MYKIIITEELIMSMLNNAEINPHANVNTNVMTFQAGQILKLYFIKLIFVQKEKKPYGILR